MTCPQVCLFWGHLTVLCSSSCRTRNECSKIEYMILPMPKDGSMTLGTISSTVGQEETHEQQWLWRSNAPGQVRCCILPCRVFWNLFTLTMSLVSLNVLPSVSELRLNSLQTDTWKHKQIHPQLLQLGFSQHFCKKLPSFIEKLLLIADVAFVTDRQEVQNQLGVFLVGCSNGSLIGLKLGNINHFVWRH